MLIIRLLSRLPLGVLYALADLLWYPVKRLYRRPLVLQNIQSVFPNYSSQQVEKITDQFYRRFLEVVAEIIKAYTISEEELRKRVHFTNPELTFDLQTAQKPLLFFAAHQCNWEWMALASGLHLSTSGSVVYKPLQSKKADHFVKTVRSRFGGSPISKEAAPRQLLQLRNQHCIIGLVADQSPPRQKVYWAYAFGKESAFYPGLVQLPYMMQAHAVFGRIKRKKRGYYEVELSPIGSPPYAKNDKTVLRRYIEEMEQLIQDSPEDYLWTHNRWKHSRTDKEEMITFS